MRHQAGGQPDRRPLVAVLCKGPLERVPGSVFEPGTFLRAARKNAESLLPHSCIYGI